MGVFAAVVAFQAAVGVFEAVVFVVGELLAALLVKAVSMCPDC